MTSRSEPSPKAIFLASVDRCANSPDFIPSFYDDFLNSSEEVRRKFQFTDFEQQNEMLLRSLKLTAAATSGDRAGLRELQERARTHDRYHLDIAPPMYELWRTALIATARVFDPQWSEPVEDAWSEILGHVIQHMIRHY